MAYTDQAAIIREVRGLEVNDDTVVKTADITEWIAQADAYINGRLAAYYETPITGTDALAIIKTIATYKVVHRVKNKLELTSENSDKKQDVQANLDKQAEKMLDQLLPKMEGGAMRDPLLKLPGATLVSRSPETAAISAHKALTPTFEKGGDNW